VVGRTEEGEVVWREEEEDGVRFAPVDDLTCERQRCRERPRAV
jgi:hypothetical protein